MKKGRILGAILCCCLAWAVPVFGAEDNTTNTSMEKQSGTISFLTFPQQFVIGTQDTPSVTFYIEEQIPNVLWENGKIYITLKSQKVEDSSAIAVQTPIVEGENITAKGEILEDGHTIVITVGKREITENVTPKDITITPTSVSEKALTASEETLATIKVTVPISVLEEESTPLKSYDLWLLSGKDKDNNIFIQKEDILLHSSFFNIIDEEAQEQAKAERETQYYKDLFPSLQFTIGQKTVLWDDTPLSLEQEVFLSEEGKTMIALEDFIALVEEMEQINDYIQMTLEDGIYTITVPQYEIILEPAAKQMTYSGKGIQYILIEKEGVLYLPLRECYTAMGMEDSIHWDGETKTVTID